MPRTITVNYENTYIRYKVKAPIYDKLIVVQRLDSRYQFSAELLMKIETVEFYPAWLREGF